MKEADLQYAYEKKKTFEKEDSSGVFIVLGLGMMKCPLTGWVDSCTYMSVKTKDTFTRPRTDFAGFRLRGK